MIAATAVGAVMSYGAVSLPGEVSYISSIAPIALALGVPIAPLALLVAVEMIPDIFRTVGNVTMDVATRGDWSSAEVTRDPFVVRIADSVGRRKTTSCHVVRDRRLFDATRSINPRLQRLSRRVEGDAMQFAIAVAISRPLLPPLPRRRLTSSDRSDPVGIEPADRLLLAVGEPRDPPARRIASEAGDEILADDRRAMQAHEQLGVRALPRAPPSNGE